MCNEFIRPPNVGCPGPEYFGFGPCKYTVTASNISLEFAKDNDFANAKYGEQYVCVKGKVANVNKLSVELEKPERGCPIILEFDPKHMPVNIKSGQQTAVQGQVLLHMPEVAKPIKLWRCRMPDSP